MNEPHSTSEFKILCAINLNYLHAHEVAPGQHNRFYLKNADFIEAPVEISMPGYHALGLMGRTEEGVILTFRSLLLEQPRDAMGLYKAISEIASGKMSTPRSKYWPKGAATQASTWKLLSSAWKPLLKELKERLFDEEGNQLPLYIGGHNQGGILAAQTALRLWLGEDIKIEQVVTFGSPRPGDEEFAEAYNKHFQKKHLNFVTSGDLIPLLPADDELQKHIQELPEMYELLASARRKNSAEVGTLKFIRADGKVLTGGHAPGMAKRWELALAQFQPLDENPEAVEKVMDPHRPALNFPYMNAVAPEDLLKEEEDQKDSENQDSDHDEEWEKKLRNNPGCFPFGWLFGI